MKFEEIKIIYFLGIGGIGMSALARFFLLQEKEVHGYDLTPTEITSQLMGEGAHIHFEEDIHKIPKQVDAVVFTPAVPKEHKEYCYFREHHIPLLKRSEVLGIICSGYPTIAIAGTHGKTTTTAMVTQMMCNSEWQPEINHPKILSFIGGIAKNFNSNFVYMPGFDTVVAEADEFDRSFLTLHPQVAVITSMDADHLDIYGNVENMRESFQLFANQIQPDGTLIIYDEIANQIAHPRKITYGFSEQAQYKISNIQYFPTKTIFELTYRVPLSLKTSLKWESHSGIPFVLHIQGKHNVLNAVAAFAASLEFLIWKNSQFSNFQSLITSLSKFTGVSRRFDVRIQRPDFVYIDDYAHHPAEIRAFLDAVKKSYPDKKITGIFQPHLYSRTRDFAREFADALEVLDEIILLDIYPAREEPLEGITSEYLLSLIHHKNKTLLSKENILSHLQQKRPNVLLTMGAGDIDKLIQDSRLLSFI